MPKIKPIATGLLVYIWNLNFIVNFFFKMILFLIARHETIVSLFLYEVNEWIILTGYLKNWWTFQTGLSTAELVFVCFENWIEKFKI